MVANSYLTVNYTVSNHNLGSGYGGNNSMTFLPGISEVSVNLTPSSYESSASGSVTVTMTPSLDYEIIGTPSNTVQVIGLSGPGANVFRRVDVSGGVLAEGGGKGQFVLSRYYNY